MRIIDTYHDPGLTTMKFLLREHPGVAEYVKTAGIERDIEKVASSAFAWESERLFPVHNEKEAALSWLYAKDNPSVPLPVKDQIKEALEAYKIPMSMFTRLTEKQASADECVFPDSRTYPIRTVAEVKLAEKRLIEQVSRMTPNTIAQAFSRIYEKCAELGIEPEPRTYQYCGRTVTNVRRLVDAITARASATKTAEHIRAYEKLAEGVEKDPRALQSRSTQLKLADALQELDFRSNIHQHYHKGIPDAITSVFNTQKVAAGGVNLGDVVVSPQQLEQLGPDFFSDALGPDILSSISDGAGGVNGDQAAAVIDTLPADMKNSFRNALKSAGI